MEWPQGADEPSHYWLSNQSASTPLNTLVRTAKARWRIERDYLGTQTGGQSASL